MTGDFIGWNLSKYGRRLSSANGFVVSFPKSGRTWLRVFYYSYLSNVCDLDFTLDHDKFAEFPRLAFTHDRWEHRFVPGWWNYIRGKRLIPRKARREKPIVLLARDPRDVVVSLYFHLAKRPNVFRWGRLPISQMIRCPRFGVSTVIGIMNQWIDEWHQNANFLLLRYEELHADRETFRQFLSFLDLPIDESAFEAAIWFSSFQNMHDLEARGGFKTQMLSAGNPSDPDSFKVRRGKVKGYIDYLTEADIAYLDAQMGHLDSRYDYSIEALENQCQVAPASIG